MQMNSYVEILAQFMQIMWELQNVAHDHGYQVSINYLIREDPITTRKHNEGSSSKLRFGNFEGKMDKFGGKMNTLGGKLINSGVRTRGYLF